MIDIDQIALDTMEKVYAIDPAKLRGGDAQAKAIIQCLIYAAIQVAITRQADAARRGMDAAKEAGAHMEAEARRLYAECNPEALESERAANAQLTEDLQRTEAERDALAAHIHQLDKHWRRMHELLEGDPTGSIALARLKAQWQAEVLDELMPAICDVADRAEVRSLRDELRRQAEGGE